MTDKEKCKFCDELLSRLKQLKSDLEEAHTENTKMKIVLVDNGLSDEDVNKISDLEATCAEQLKKYKEISVHQVFTKDDAKVIETLGNTLLRIRGGKVKSDNSKAAKGLSLEDLNKHLKLADVDNG